MNYNSLNELINVSINEFGCECEWMIHESVHQQMNMYEVVNEFI